MCRALLASTVIRASSFRESKLSRTVRQRLPLPTIRKISPTRMTLNPCGMPVTRELGSRLASPFGSPSLQTRHCNRLEPPRGRAWARKPKGALTSTASSATEPWTRAAENFFATNAATGHNYFFASGDQGSMCDPGSNANVWYTYPDYPASSPNVISVGGTHFSHAPTSSYPGETAWPYSNSPSYGPEGSGGGYSNIFSR